MKYGRMAGNNSINDMIYRCFDHIAEQDVCKFVRCFREQPHDENQVMHTFRELILGAYLASHGFKARYDQRIGDKTPDWCILDEVSAVQCVVEVVNFHIDRATEQAMERKFGEGEVFIHWQQSNVPRLRQRVAKKAAAYKRLVTARGLAYVVAVFAMFTANVELKEVEECLHGQDYDAFGLHPELTGVLFFREDQGRYRFDYIANPRALRPMDLPSGELQSYSCRDI